MTVSPSGIRSYDDYGDYDDPLVGDGADNRVSNDNDSENGDFSDENIV